MDHEDAKRFTGSAMRLQDQVGSYEPLPGKKVNGALTLGESIADLAGLNVAYDAYKRSLGGKEAPVLDGFTGEQRFFMSFAQVWRWKGRDAAVDQQLKNDPHPPSSIRAEHGAQHRCVVRSVQRAAGRQALLSSPKIG